MDENLRLLERQAALGDERALRALERSRIRLGRGWFDEPLPRGLRTAAARPLYLWTPPRGYALELVRAPAGFWITRQPISAVLWKTFRRASSEPVSRGPAVTFEEARLYAGWAGLRLPTIVEWQSLPKELRPGVEWVTTDRGPRLVADVRSPPAWLVRPTTTASFRVVCRS